MDSARRDIGNYPQSAPRLSRGLSRIQHRRSPSGAALDTIPALGSGVRGVSVSKCPRTASAGQDQMRPIPAAQGPGRTPDTPGTQVLSCNPRTRWVRGTAGKEKASGTDWFRRLFQGWQMRDSNPRRRCQLIYSQPPLAARVICRTSKEDHSRFPVPERLFPVRSASSTRGQDNFTELPPKNRIGASAAQKWAKMPGNSGLSENASGQPRLESCRLLRGDLVQLDRPGQVRVDTVHAG